MKLTNKLGLPEAVFSAIANDPYNKGEADFSVTELIAPPRQRALMRKHDHELEEDVSDRLWSLYGQIVHLLLERANSKTIKEQRFFGKFGHYTVSGQVDSLCLDSGVLSDFKFTTSWSFMAGRPPKDEWIQQLNMQLELLRLNGYDAEKLEIIGLLRDWQLTSAETKKGYPNTQIAKHEIPMWSRFQTTEFIFERIRLHVEARKNLPLCDSKDLWGGKRCKHYCSVGAAGFCEQFNKQKELENV